MRDLDTATTAEIVVELAKRCPAMVFGAFVPEDGNQSKPRFHVSGHVVVVSGLIETLKTWSTMGLESYVEQNNSGAANNEGENGEHNG